MAEIGLYFGTSTGATEYVAYEIEQQLNAIRPEMVAATNIAFAQPEDFARWERLILGVPTWDIGQMQTDWDIFLAEIDGLDLSDKQIAIFGLGDQYGYSDTYLDAVGMLADQLTAQGAALVGRWPAEGYQVEASLALEDGYFKGLALDEDNESSLTAERVKTWLAQVLAEFGLREEAAGAS